MIDDPVSPETAAVLARHAALKKRKKEQLQRECAAMELELAGGAPPARAVDAASPSVMTTPAPGSVATNQPASTHAPAPGVDQAMGFGGGGGGGGGGGLVFTFTKKKKPNKPSESA